MYTKVEIHKDALYTHSIQFYLLRSLVDSISSRLGWLIYLGALISELRGQAVEVLGGGCLETEWIKIEILSLSDQTEQNDNNDKPINTPSTEEKT